jgi:hypothetical protein
MSKSYKKKHKKHKKSKRKITRKIKRRQYRKRKGGTITSACDYDTSNGIKWPENHGCLEEEEKILVLNPDTIIDRFGGDGGFYFGDKSSTFDNRSLISLRPGSHCETEYNERLETKKILYTQYKVIRPFRVKTCTIAPAFGHEGHGAQYRLYEDSIEDPDIDPNGGDRITPSVKTMIDKGYIEVKPIINAETEIPPFE